MFFAANCYYLIMKKKILFYILISLLFVSIAGIIISSILIEKNQNNWWTLLVSFTIFFCLLILTFIAYFPNVEFICRKCNKQFKPSISKSLFSMHFITRHYIRCPHCNQLSWAKATWDINKQNQAD